MKYLYFLIILLLPIVVSATPPYHYNYVYPQQTIIQRHTVEFDADTYLGLNGYNGVQDKLKLENARQNQVDSETIKTLAEALKLALGGNGALPQTEKITEEPKKSELSLDREVYNIFKANCAGCHSEGASGGLKLLAKDGLYDLSAVQRSKVYFRTTGPNLLKEMGLPLMPLNKSPLSDNDIKILYKWALQKINQEKK